jgi:hypothetical protein
MHCFPQVLRFAGSQSKARHTSGLISQAQAAAPRLQTLSAPWFFHSSANIFNATAQRTLIGTTEDVGQQPSIVGRDNGAGRAEPGRLVVSVHGAPQRSHRFPAMSRNTATQPYGSVRGPRMNVTPGLVRLPAYRAHAPRRSPGHRSGCVRPLRWHRSPKSSCQIQSLRVFRARCPAPHRRFGSKRSVHGRNRIG